MKIVSTYSVKIKEYNHISNETTSIYRKSVDYFINVCSDEWDIISTILGNHGKMNYTEHLCHFTKDNTKVIVNEFEL